MLEAEAEAEAMQSAEKVDCWKKKKKIEIKTVKKEGIMSLHCVEWEK